ncbi:tripartite tricarboxylate transporter substrate binding protein [Variovorax sp. LjRoot84]|uniref:Bug family tripartite tricarboxylate transporter substrate binding protein n=1 Tax=Variovorax sp. LjRoot84 TaxID=3342340 RepID=UPI003ECDB4E6
MHLHHLHCGAARRAALLTIALAGIALAHTAPTRADTYPERPIRIVVPFPAGGYSDALARIIALGMGKTFGQAALVDNRPGAGGNIGADLVAKSPADGYTLVMGTIGTHAINATLYQKVPFDGIKDFAPVAFVADAETVLVVNPSVPARTPKELIALAKAKPNEMTFASGGAGTTGHLAGELFKAATGTSMTHIPYKGNAPALTDLVAGQVSLSFATLQPALPFIKAGKLVPLATLGKTRSPALPNVPTLEELGMSGFEVRNWTGILAPAGTPSVVLKKLSDEIDKVMRSEEVQAKLQNEGLKYTPMGPEVFSRFVKSETDKWAKVVKAAGVQAD